MSIAHEQMRRGATTPEAWLIPAAGRPGYVPATALAWLEPLRERHERLAARLAAAVRVPDRIREITTPRWPHGATGCAQPRANGEEPPERGVRLSPAWLAGRIDAAEADIAELVRELLQVLRDVEAAFVEHEAEVDALVAQLDDGFGGALVRAQLEAAGEPPLPSSRLLAGASAVARWRRVKVHDGRAAVAVDLWDLGDYPRRRAERRPTEGEVSAFDGTRWCRAARCLHRHWLVGSVSPSRNATCCARGSRCTTTKRARSYR